ncbi:MAG: acyl-CoA thioesterase [Bacteroidetes bacterium]|nr:acyl-CoA thioesterase [Bacteroidota bacterium]
MDQKLHHHPSQGIPIAKHTSQIRVRYADTDQMGIVHHARYLEYFEAGRSDLIRALGVSYAQLEQQGIFLPVIEIHANYKKPARYDEIILVDSIIYEYPVITLKIWYNIYDENRMQLLVEGWSIHGFFNKETKRLVRPPKNFLNLLTLSW